MSSSEGAFDRESAAGRPAEIKTDLGRSGYTMEVWETGPEKTFAEEFARRLETTIRELRAAGAEISPATRSFTTKSSATEPG